MVTKNIYDGVRLKEVFGNKLPKGWDILEGTDAERILSCGYYSFDYDAADSYLLEDVAVVFSYTSPYKDTARTTFSLKLVGEEEKIGEVEKIVLDALEKWRRLSNDTK